MRDIHHILCPVELSEVSRHAIDHAILLAEWYKAKITALYVCHPIVIPSTDFTLVRTGPVSFLTDAEIEDIRARIRGFFNRADSNNVDVVIDYGQPATRILKHVRSLPADLIVIGTHGTSGFEHLVLGSVTEKVLRKAACPVLTVPPQAQTTSKLPFKRLLCPVDFSESSLAALQFAFSLAQEGDAALTILHVFEWLPKDQLLMTPINVPEYHQQLEHDFAAKLEALVPDSIRSWCRPTTRTAFGKPYREILSTATGDKSDLIVMGVHGRNPLDLMLFGSTTNQVVRRASCPVLTLRS